MYKIPQSQFELLMREHNLGINYNKELLSNVDFSDVDLSKMKVRLKNGNLCGSRLSEKDLSEANLEGADLSHSNLVRANLSGANLRGANLRGADLTGAKLSGATLTLARIVDAKFDNTGILVYHGGLYGDNMALYDPSNHTVTYGDLRCSIDYWMMILGDLPMPIVKFIRHCDILRKSNLKEITNLKKALDQATNRYPVTPNHTAEKINSLQAEVDRLKAINLTQTEIIEQNAELIHELTYENRDLIDRINCINIVSNTSIPTWR